MHREWHKDVPRYFRVKQTKKRKLIMNNTNTVKQDISFFNIFKDYFKPVDNRVMYALLYAVAICSVIFTFVLPIVNSWVGLIIVLLLVVGSIKLSKYIDTLQAKENKSN